MEEKMKNDLYWEHEAHHTSDDWKNLKDRCSECDKACRRVTNFISRDWREELGCGVSSALRGGLFGKGTPWDVNPLE